MPLGVACADDPEICGVGECLRNTTAPWPDGACAIPDPTPDGCRPATVYMAAGAPNGIDGYFIKRCDHDEDCARGINYVCDPGIGGCVPNFLMSMTLTSSPRPTPFCAGEDTLPPDRPN